MDKLLEAFNSVIYNHKLARLDEVQKLRAELRKQEENIDVDFLVKQCLLIKDIGYKLVDLEDARKKVRQIAGLE